METRQTDPDMNHDDVQRPDRAKYDELGRVVPQGEPTKPSRREQPAKAVHVEPSTEPKKTPFVEGE